MLKSREDQTVILKTHILHLLTYRTESQGLSLLIFKDFSEISFSCSLAHTDLEKTQLSEAGCLSV